MWPINEVGVRFDELTRSIKSLNRRGCSDVMGCCPRTTLVAVLRVRPKSLAGISDGTVRLSASRVSLR